MMHQSCPAVRFRRDSQPSIHLPNSVNSSLKMGSPGRRRRAASANHSAVGRPTFVERCKNKLGGGHRRVWQSSGKNVDVDVVVVVDFIAALFVGADKY